MLNPREYRFPTARMIFLFCRQILMGRQGIKDVEQFRDLDLGDLLQFDAAQTSRWKHGKSTFTDVTKLNKLAKRLNVDIQLLIALALGNMTVEQAFEVAQSQEQLIEQLSGGKEEIGKLFLCNGRPCVKLMTMYHGEGDIVTGMRETILSMDTMKDWASFAHQNGLVLVDSDPQCAEVFLNVVREINGKMAVRVTENPFDGLILLGANHPRLVVMDVFHPSVNGFEFLHRVRKTYPEQDLILVGLGKSESEEVRERALACGADIFMRKPLNAERIKAVLGDIIKGT